MSFDSLIKSRRSVRKFKSIKPDWRDIIEAIDAARYAPMAGNNYSVRFIVVDNKEKILKITEACQQDFLSQAEYIVVVISDPKRTINAYGEQGNVFARQQAGAAVENFWLKLIEKGLSTCWVGYFAEDEIKQTLKIPEEMNVEAVLPVGYSNEKTGRSVKVNLDNILYFNKYGEKRMKPLRKLSA